MTEQKKGSAPSAPQSVADFNDDSKIAELQKVGSPASALVQVGERGIMLRSMDELLRFSAMVVRGGAAPKNMTEGQAAVAIQAGLERGLGPLGGLQQCVVINGVLSWRGQGAVALIQNSGRCKTGTFKSWVEGEGDERKGVCVAHRIGYQEPDRKEFSVKDAKRANLWAKAGPWQEYPDGQLEWRAVGIMGKRVFSDVLGGFPIDVEAGDYTVLELTRTPEGTKPPELPQPSTPDPLFDAIAKAGVAPAPSEEKIIDAEVVTVTDATVAEVKVFETEASPPYPQKWYREERCEHGTVTGDFCRECSVEMDGGEAQQEQTNERDDAPGLFEIPGQSKRKRR